MKTQPTGRENRNGNAKAGLLHILLAGGIALVVAFVVLMLKKATFASVDEQYIAQALAGCYADRPMVWVPYLSPLLTRLLSLMYRLVPSVAWYAVAQEALAVAGMTVINACVIRQIRRSFPGREFIVGGLIGIVVNAMLSWTLTRLSMYHTAAVVGCAALCLLFSEGFEGGRFWPRWVMAFALFFFAVGFAPVAGVGLLLLVLLVAAHRTGILSKSKRSGKKALVRAASLVAAMGLLLAVSLVLLGTEQRRLCDGRYADWRALRAAYTEGEPADYSENARLYAGVDWSEDFSKLVSAGYLMDERFNADAVDQIMVRKGPTSALSNAFLVTDMSASDTRLAIFGLAIIVHALLFAGVAMGARDRSRRAECLVVVACTVVSDLICALLFLKWSIGLPAMLILGLPCALLSLLLLIDNACAAIGVAGEDGADSGDDGLKRYRLGILLALVGLIVSRVGLGVFETGVNGLLPGGNSQEDLASEYGKTSALYSYVSEHKEQRYVYDKASVMAGNPFQVLRVGDLANLYCWDEAYCYAYPYAEQLRINGLDAPLRSSDLAAGNVRLISNSEDNIRALLRFLGDTGDTRFCVVEEELDGGLFVARFQADYDVDGAEPKKTAPVRILMCDDEEGVKAYEPISVAPTSGSVPEVCWLAEDSFVVYYHEYDHSKASPRVTCVPYGVETATLTYEQLGYFKPGKLFLGWKVYREDTRCWLAEDGEDGSVWMRTMPSDRKYKLYTNRIKLKEAVPKGVALHLFAQWEDTDAFTVYYHPSAKDADNSYFTEVTYGTPTVTTSHAELGFIQPGKQFAGWRVYRTDTRQWLVETDSKEGKWAGKLPKGGKYLLYGDEAVVSDLVPAGARVHFYAEWEDVDYYTIHYCGDDYADASASVTKAKYDEAVSTLTVEELGFSAGEGTFAGWRVYRPDSRKWLVLDPFGDQTWSTDLPSGWQYCIYEDGADVFKLSMPGTDVCFSAQWDNDTQYTVYYHCHEYDDTSKTRTYAYSDRALSLPTLKKLGISEEPAAFAGWKVYCEDDEKWLAIDAYGREQWTRDLPEEGEFRLYDDGEVISGLSEPGKKIHFFATWYDMGSFTVFYHDDEEAEASELTTSVVYGEATPTLMLDELGIFRLGRSFQGWKVCNESSGEWLVVDGDGVENWSRILPTGCKYRLIGEGEELSKLVPPGTELHFYAQWE